MSTRLFEVEKLFLLTQFFSVMTGLRLNIGTNRSVFFTSVWISED
jgi:hypothetical protein